MAPAATAEAHLTTDSVGLSVSHCLCCVSLSVCVSLCVPVCGTGGADGDGPAAPAAAAGGGQSDVPQLAADSPCCRSSGRTGAVTSGQTN